MLKLKSFSGILKEGQADIIFIKQTIFKLQMELSKEVSGQFIDGKLE
jgi:hypothetical protein